MNYNLNTFVISTGEYLAALSHSAPWMNSQPINHGQSYMILSAIHEELFNEIFPWANIDNTIQQAIGRVYNGFGPLVMGRAKVFRFVHGEYALANERELMNKIPIYDLAPGQPLPAGVEGKCAYRIHGGKTYADYLTNFVNNTIAQVRWSLHNELNKYLGTSRNYEWYFEYTANGIVYTRQQEAVINYVQPEMPETEHEYINQEISLMAKPVITSIPHLEINTHGYENVNWSQFMEQVPHRLNYLYQAAVTAGVNEVKVSVRYLNPMHLRELCDVIAHTTQFLPVRFKVESERRVDEHNEMVQAINNVNRNLSNRSVQVMNDQQGQLANQLLELRNRIIKRNNVVELDMKELGMLVPDLLNISNLNDDLVSVMHTPDMWHKLNNVNPEKLCYPVVGLAIAISNHIDVLNGNAPSNVSIPIFNPATEQQPISVIPLYCN